MHMTSFFENYTHGLTSWVLYNTPMRRSPFSILFFLFSALLTSCAPVASPGALFFYIRQGDAPTLVLLRDPDSHSPVGEIPLASPPDCSFWSLSPAPTGPLAALEWQCPSGPLTQVVDTSPLPAVAVQGLGSQKIVSLLDDPSIDTHFLAWSPDGRSVYLKAGALSNPQILRVDAISRQVTVLPIPANTYSLAVSPADGTIVWALTGGIGSGSQVWGSDAQSANSQIVLSDPANIIGLMRYAPDGRHIAAIRLPDDQSALPPGELWLADSDGKHAHFAATADAGRGMFPVWSPNGEKIAFIGRTHPRDPASINLSVLTLFNLQLSTLNLKPEAPPTWSPDGSRLYFTLASDGKMEVWSYEISTGKTEKLFENACCVGWTEAGKR
jgi:WD40 repeat protein